MFAEASAVKSAVVTANMSARRLKRSVKRRMYEFPREVFNDWRGRGYDDFVPGEVNKTAPSGDEPT